VDLEEFSPLEQQDFVAAEQKEILLRFIEQTNYIYANASDPEQAKKLVERLQRVLFVDYDSYRRSKDRAMAQELMDLTQKAYKLTVVGGQGYLSIEDDD
jgi:hypothetical protein